MTTNRKIEIGACGLLIIGAVGAISYIVYFQNYSGSEVGEYAVMTGQGAWLKIGSVTFGAEKKNIIHNAGPIKLEPEMNPLRAILKIKRKRANSRPLASLNYDIALVDSKGNKVFEKSGKHTKQRKPKKKNDTTVQKSTSIPLGTFDVQESDNYAILCSLKDQGERSFSSEAIIQVRRNVTMMNPVIPITGGVLAAIGLVMLIVVKIKAGKTKKGGEEPGHGETSSSSI